MARPQTMASLEAKGVTEVYVQPMSAALAVGIAEMIAKLIKEGTTSIEAIETMGSTVLQKEREEAAIDTATSAEQHE